MKKNEIEHIVNGHFKVIEKLFHKIILDFDTNDIQEFRLAIRKLRAFFHLLDMENDSDTPVKVTGKMKTFYGYVGIVRNLQLQVERIDNYAQQAIGHSPHLYINKLKADLLYWKKNTRDFMDYHNNFYNDEDRIRTLLPDKLTKHTIRKFLRFVMYELHKKLSRLDKEEDETLHSIRGYLEDILYNWEYVKHYVATFAPGLSKEEEIQPLVRILGVFRDKCIAYTLLQTYHNETASEEEKLVLKSILNTCRIRKEELKQVIYSLLEKIPVEPIVSGSFSYRNWF